MAMIVRFDYLGERYEADLQRPLDISIRLHAAGPRAWYVDPMRIAPVISHQFTGSVRLGGRVNFREIRFNPHGHGTHTECVGHITREDVSVNEVLHAWHMTAVVVTVVPEEWTTDTGWMRAGDKVITEAALAAALGDDRPEAVIIRTLPNSERKLSANYSSSNFPYFEPSALGHLAQCGVKHVLVDLPSVDREEDGGELLAHRAFWYDAAGARPGTTITEFVFVPDAIKDGMYLLELQVAPFVNDAAPSRPVLYSPVRSS